MQPPTDPAELLARYTARAAAAIPEGREDRWVAIPGCFAALYRRDERLMIAGFQAHAQQGIAALLRVLAVRAGSGFVDLDRTLLGVYDHFMVALLAYRGGGMDHVDALAPHLPDGTAAALRRIDDGEISEGNLDLLWTEQAYVQRAFYGRHRVLAWAMSRRARMDFGAGGHWYPRRFDPRASLGNRDHRVAWDRQLWRAWEQVQGQADQLARIDEIIAAGRAAGADCDFP